MSRQLLCFSLLALRICRVIFYSRFNRRTEFQPAIIFLNVIQNLKVFRLCAEGDLANGQPSVFCSFKHPNPKRVIKKYRQSGHRVHTNPSKNIFQGTDDPEGRVTYLSELRRPGYLPALVQKARCVFIPA